jgi:hypothetical protein
VKLLQRGGSDYFGADGQKASYLSENEPKFDA